MKVSTLVFTLITLLIPFGAVADSVHLRMRVNYQTAMSHIEEKDLFVVKELAQVAKKFPNSRILIGGHTDIIGSYSMNLELSKGRAEIFKMWLLRYGVEEDRIETKWFSYDAPVATNTTPQGRSQNRRVVATIYSLSSAEAKSLSKYIKNSQEFGDIQNESAKVDSYVDKVLIPKIKEKEEETVGVGQSKEILEIEEDFQSSSNETSSSDQKLEQVTSELFENEDFDSSHGAKGQGNISNETNTKKEELKYSDSNLKKKKLSHRYYLGWSLIDSEINAKRTGFEALWVTDFIHSLSLAYQLQLGSRIWLGLNAEYRGQDYKNENNPIYSWDEDTPDLIKIGALLNYEPSKSFGISFNLSYSEKIFVITNVLDITLQKEDMFVLDANGIYKFYENKKYSSRINFGFNLPISSSSDLDLSGSVGILLGADLSLKKVMKNYDLNIGILYGTEVYENIQNDQDEQFIRLNFKFQNRKWL